MNCVHISAVTLTACLLGTGTMMAIPQTARADYETFSLSPGFRPNPVVGSGQSGGDRWIEGCGYVNPEDAPDHVLELTGNFEHLEIGVVADGDLTLVMKQVETGETKCVDDSTDSLLPEFAGTWPAGTYHLWVGDWESAYYRYEIYIRYQ
ncbi:MAG: hypothetical protein QNJ46_03490 [Leptolyngbyaceae cyanobacterium MO_188.B28]|nr:hypothetical protein [Leptolyngbyaceae cyanobacterium MO_188.B28]